MVAGKITSNPSFPINLVFYSCSLSSSQKFLMEGNEKMSARRLKLGADFNIIVQCSCSLSI